MLGASSAPKSKASRKKSMARTFRTRPDVREWFLIKCPVADAAHGNFRMSWQVVGMSLPDALLFTAFALPPSYGQQNLAIDR